MLCGLAILLGVLKRFTFKQSITIICTYLIAMIPLTALINTYDDQIFAAFGRDPSLTGRAIIWPYVAAIVAQKPLGYGYGGYFQDWRGYQDPSLASPLLGVLRSAHNNFLECMLNVGIIGLALYLLAFFSLLFLAVKYFYVAPSLQEPATPLLLLAGIIVCGLGETTGIAGFYNPSIFWMFFILIQVRLRLDLKKLDRQVPRNSKVLYGYLN